MTISIVGVDCATVDKKVGIAFGVFEDGELEITQARACGPGERVVEILADHIMERNGSTVIALDAPLGWPEEMTRVLAGHKAGDCLAPDQKSMFCRETDRFVREKVGKRPLDVGADRIARTAHSALCLLAELRDRLKAPIPLAWGVPLEADVSAIEVYPGATLTTHGIEPTGYKNADQREARKAILRKLRSLLQFSADSKLVLGNADALDAVVCALAAADFLRQDVWKPEDANRAVQEGWIWTRRASL